MFHKWFTMFYNVSLCITMFYGVSWCFTMFNNILQCLASRTTIDIAASATTCPPIASGIGNNEAGIGDNSAERRWHRRDRRYRLKSDLMLNPVLNGDWSNSVLGRQIPKGCWVRMSLHQAPILLHLMAGLEKVLISHISMISNSVTHLRSYTNSAIADIAGNSAPSPRRALTSLHRAPMSPYRVLISSHRMTSVS